MSEELENITNVLPEVNFPFHEDNLKLKEMTDEPMQNRKKVFLKVILTINFIFSSQENETLGTIS